MFRVKVGAAVLNQLPLDWEGNRRRIRSVLAQARAAGVTVLCLPEMCIPGYGCEDAFHSLFVLERSWLMLMELLPDTEGLVVCIGLPLLHQHAVFNAVALVADKKILGFSAKRYLAGDGIHYEPRWFKPWAPQVAATLERDGRSWPLGDLLYDVGGVKIGFEICEDAWVAGRPGADAASYGADLILNPSASHFAFGKIDVRRRFVIEGSRAFGVTYLYANLLGNESGRAIYDGGVLIASGGREVARGGRFLYTEAGLVSAVVDLSITRMAQARTASFRPALVGRDGLVAGAFDWPATTEAVSLAVPEVAEWEHSPRIKEEEFVRAEALALFDYLRKSRSFGFVVSLSGGADSTAVACLVATMVTLAVGELGIAEVHQRLAHIPNIDACVTKVQLIRKLLLTVYQGTEHSSEVTRDAARVVADALGAEHHELHIGGLVDSYVGVVEAALGRTLSWEKDDFTLQNIQARARGPSIWMFANLRNALLLATSNRSEAAVGYATMDGDTCGGLSPIAGIDKYFLRNWLSWMEQAGPIGIGPTPALGCVTRQRSTPELRPANAAQTSEGDLMPFVVLDAVERAAIRDKRSPAEALVVLGERFPEVPRATLVGWIEHFFRLWGRNQWKRERYAPSFHLDDENLDPKTWCRFPILSGGFAEELAALRAGVMEPPTGAGKIG